MNRPPSTPDSLDKRLDEALEMTFPASDPVALHRPKPDPETDVVEAKLPGE